VFDWLVAFTEDKVSLELTEEILQSMEVGMAFRDYVSLSPQLTNFYFCYYRLYDSYVCKKLWLLVIKNLAIVDLL